MCMFKNPFLQRTYINPEQEFLNNLKSVHVIAVSFVLKDIEFGHWSYLKHDPKMLDRCVTTSTKKSHIFPVGLLVLSAGIIGSFWRQAPFFYFFSDVALSQGSNTKSYADWNNWLLYWQCLACTILITWNTLGNIFIFFLDTYSKVDLSCS